MSDRNDTFWILKKFELIAFMFLLTTVSTYTLATEKSTGSPLESIDTDYSTDVYLSEYSDDPTVCLKEDHNRTCCNHKEFQCRDGYCIDNHKLCDTKYDCPDNSDEDGCMNSSCSLKTVTCDQKCQDLPGNHSRCACYQGYTLKKKAPNGYFCDDIDECEIGVHWCSHICLNLNGTFKCVCMSGFKNDNATFLGTCKANDQNIQILYSSDAWIYSYNVAEHKVSPVVHSGRVDEMDIDPASNMIYWSTRHRVGRSFLPGAKDGKVTVGHPQSVGTSSIWHVKNSFAIDWSARNLYWISVDILNINKYQILVSKLDGRYVKTLVDDVMLASSLVVDPENGKMYWTKGGTNPGIGTAWMNGMYVKLLLSLENSRNPTALTLDHMSAGRLYWSDSKTNSIYSVYTDGLRPSKIITLNSADLPLMMDVFENYLYWVTKDSGKLVRHDKFGRGTLKPLVEKLINQTAAKVYHPKRVEVDIRKALLYCRNQCTHLCLHVPRGYSCSCPDGSRLLLQNGEILCNTEVEEELGEPLICNCEDKSAVCNSSLPQHNCHCPGVKCDDDVTQSPDYEEMPYDPEVLEEHGHVEISDDSKWIMTLIFFCIVIPVMICFTLSFFKKPERNTVNPEQVNTSNVVGFNAEDSSMAQGVPALLKSDNETESRNNGFDNPSYLETQSDFTSSTQQLVL